MTDRTPPRHVHPTAIRRRALLQILGTGLIVPPALVATPSILAAQTVKRDRRPVALLVPLTGPRAALGLSMQQAVALADSGPELSVHDTGGTAQGAALAARNALKSRAALLIGPVSTEEMQAVTAVVARRVPVIGLTNNAAIRTPGGYIFGITPEQGTHAILRYARTRGVRNVVVIDDGSPWSSAAARAADAAKSEIGLTLRVLTVTAGAPLPIAGDAPDALLLPGSGEAVLAAARTLKDSGIQLLGTVQALDYRPAALDVLTGAWIASPDPAAFGKFAGEYRARHGGSPGALAALAYDAAGVVKTLRTAGGLSEAALLAQSNYTCVTGNARFRSDGSVARELAILVAGAQGYDPVAVSLGA